eukprot:10336871-Karenia_brevis.AAC.1
MMGWRIENADLWQNVDVLLDTASVGSVLATKVKGHAFADDVVAGVSTPTDRYGNHEADRLATTGSAMHAVPRELLLLARARLLWRGTYPWTTCLPGQEADLSICEISSTDLEAEVLNVSSGTGSEVEIVSNTGLHPLAAK